MEQMDTPRNPAPASEDAGFDRFVSRASHDLRAPIRHIRLLAGWLVEDHGAELSAGALEKIADLGRCADRLEALVGGLVDYLRAGIDDQPMAPIDTGRLVAGVLGRAALPEAMTVTVGAALPAVWGAPEAVARVFAELIGNAVRHHGQPVGAITIEGAAAGREALFRVRDDGPGIDPAFRAAVFEPFRSLRPRDEAEGSGMGLAIAQRIVARHGGRIWVEDNGRAPGCCVAFTLACPPVRQDDPPDGPETRSAGRA